MGGPRCFRCRGGPRPPWHLPHVRTPPCAPCWEQPLAATSPSPPPLPLTAARSEALGVPVTSFSTAENESRAMFCHYKSRLCHSSDLGLNPSSPHPAVPQFPYLQDGDDTASLKGCLGEFPASWIREKCLVHTDLAHSRYSSFLPPSPQAPSLLVSNTWPLSPHEFVLKRRNTGPRV